MNINPLDDIRERYKYGVEVYVDTERQVISTRPRQKLFELSADDIDVNNINEWSTDCWFDSVTLTVGSQTLAAAERVLAGVASWLQPWLLIKPWLSLLNCAQPCQVSKADLRVYGVGWRNKKPLWSQGRWVISFIQGYPQLRVTSPNQLHPSCTRTSRLLGVDVKELITGSCWTSLRFAAVAAPPKRTLRSAETLVSNASS